MKKVVVFCAGRPDHIRLVRLIERLDDDPKIRCIFINSGQHSHTDILDKAFIENLGLRAPDYNLGIGSNQEDWNVQIANIFIKLTPLLKEIKPDLFINLGDMNSCLSGLIAKRLGITYLRIECGMRSGTLETAYKNFDLPEEVNRVAMDSIADIKCVYLHDYVPHLIREGHLQSSIKVVGNTIIEALDYYTQKWNIKSTVGNYDLVTFHRGNNMKPKTLMYFYWLVREVARHNNVKFLCYGRTKKELDKLKLKFHDIEVLEPQNQQDFLQLVVGCNMILSDSGSTSSEESHYFHKPALILRDSTERPTTLIDNNPQDGNAHLWTMDLEKDMVLYQKLRNMKRDWNNRYYDAPNGRKVSKNIHDVIKSILH